MPLRCECSLIGCDGTTCLRKQPERIETNDPTCVCGHRMGEHAQYQWSCFVRDCDCVEFRISDCGRAKQHLNRIVLSLQRNGYSGPETLKDYLEALDVLLAVVALEAKEELLVRRKEPKPIDHFFTPDPTKRFCTICGDNDLGSVWGVHRFQIQPRDADFAGPSK